MYRGSSSQSSRTSHSPSQDSIEGVLQSSLVTDKKNLIKLSLIRKSALRAFGSRPEKRSKHRSRQKVEKWIAQMTQRSSDAPPIDNVLENPAGVKNLGRRTSRPTLPRHHPADQYYQNPWNTSLVNLEDNAMGTTIANPILSRTDILPRDQEYESVAHGKVEDRPPETHHPHIGGVMTNSDLLLQLPEEEATATLRTLGAGIPNTFGPEDPSYSGFGISPEVRQELLDEINLFSNLTSVASSRRVSLADSHHAPDQVDLPLGASRDTGGAESIPEIICEQQPNWSELYVGDDEQTDLSKSEISPVDIGEIRNLLTLALSGDAGGHHPETLENLVNRGTESALQGGLPAGGMALEERRGGEETSAPLMMVPSAQLCQAFGTGLRDGLVETKNNFQVNRVPFRCLESLLQVVSFF